MINRETGVANLSRASISSAYDVGIDNEGIINASDVQFGDDDPTDATSTGTPKAPS